MAYTPSPFPHMRSTSGGELRSAPPTRLISVAFPYGLGLSAVPDTMGGGSPSVTASGGLALVACGAAANSIASIRSREYISVRRASGCRATFSAAFSTPAANSTQIAGWGTKCCGFYFGYNGTSFGILYRNGALREVRALTITTGSSTAENVTITLEGATKTVAVTNSASTTITAAEIAAGDYSTTGSGWTAMAQGSIVYFMSRVAAPLAGTFSLTATTAVGSFGGGPTTAGVAPTNTWVPQASWTAIPGMTIDPTKLNLYEISFYGTDTSAVVFSVSSQATGAMVPVYTLQLGNLYASLGLPALTFPLYWEVANGSNTTALTVRTDGGSATIDGVIRNEGIFGGVTSVKTSVTTETAILTLRNPIVFNGRENHSVLRVGFMSVASDANKLVEVRLLSGAITGGTQIFNLVKAALPGSDPADYDVAGTTITFGLQSGGIVLGKTDSAHLFVDSLEVSMSPGDAVTITGASATAADIAVSLNYTAEGVA